MAFCAVLFNGISNDTRSTLNIANRATDPKAQSKSYNAFLGIESAIFREDCDAKAHQLTYLGQQLGGHPDIVVFQSFCSEIQAPAFPARP